MNLFLPHYLSYSFLRKNDEGAINGKRFDKDEQVGKLII